MIWNVRKIGKVEKQREAKDYIRAQEADLIGLVETKVRRGKTIRISRVAAVGTNSESKRYLPRKKKKDTHHLLVKEERERTH